MLDGLVGSTINTYELHGVAMSYRNKTYVIFDGDNDIWAYGFMKGWRQSEHIEFDFYDAHDLKPLTGRAEDEQYIKARLRQRFENTIQTIVLIGPNTKNLYRFVRWEIDTAQNLNLPIIAVNLNGKRDLDSDLCPPVLRDYTAVHVVFKAKIIQYALDNFPNEYKSLKSGSPRHYSEDVYRSLGLWPSSSDRDRSA